MQEGKLNQHNPSEHKKLQTKLNRRKSDSSIKTSNKLMRANKKKIKKLRKSSINKSMSITHHNIQSLKQSLNKRVMEYKTMHSISINKKEENDKVYFRNPLKINRYIPVSKIVNNCQNSKLPCKCTKCPDLNAPYIYCMKSYMWLANAFCHSTPGSFNIYNHKELQNLVKAYNKCSVMPLDSLTEEQIQKDIVRTFPNNSECHLMCKVLSAYSNLTDMKNNYLKQKAIGACSAEVEIASNPIETEETPRFMPRSEFRKDKNKVLRDELMDSF